MSYKRVPVIKEMVINELSSYQEYCGEWSSNVDIDFMLEEKCVFNIFNQKYEIDRVKMVDYYDEIALVFANSEEEFRDFVVPKSFLHQVVKIVEYEEYSGRVQKWSFYDDLYEMLIGDNDYCYRRDYYEM